MSVVIGIDPSLTGTGIVVLRNGEVELAEATKSRPELGIIERVKLIRNRILEIEADLSDDKGRKYQSPALMVIEGFSYGSKGRSVFDIAYLGWRIREELERLRSEDGTPWIEVPPTQLKKFSTGKGTANKEIILQQVYKRWEYETDNNNIADAFVLAKIGEAYLQDNYKPDDLNLFQLEVISNLKGEKPAKKPRKKVK